MAAPMTARSPWSSFKRLRISSGPLLVRPAQTASLSTTRWSRQEDSHTDEAKSEAGESNVLADTNAAAPAAPAAQKTSDMQPPPPLPSPLDSKVVKPENMTTQTFFREYVFEMARARNIEVPPNLYPDANLKARTPRGVQALYRAPMKRKPVHNITVCNLQMRSYSVRNLEIMADFALRAAYYLNLPAKGPVPLPRITERWTVPKSVFVNKKAQENWERITTRRLIQIVDGHPDVVKRWLAFVRKWSWYGVGLRADVWEHEGIDQWKTPGQDALDAAEETTRWDLFGRRSDLVSEEAVSQYMDSLGFANDGPAPASSKVAEPTPRPSDQPKREEAKAEEAKSE